jgi:GTPase
MTDIKNKLPPEAQEGNIEYKRFLSTFQLFKRTTPEKEEYKLNKLITQMKWRVKEGSGTGIYYVGVNDNGDFHDMTNIERIATLETLMKMIASLKYRITNFEQINNSYKITITS